MKVRVLANLIFGIPNVVILVQRAQWTFTFLVKSAAIGIH